MPGTGGLVLFGGKWSRSSPRLALVLSLNSPSRSSANAALPHGASSSYKLKKEDFVLIDAGGKFHGYVADITRVSLAERVLFSRVRVELSS